MFTLQFIAINHITAIIFFGAFSKFLIKGIFVIKVVKKYVPECTQGNSFLFFFFAINCSLHVFRFYISGKRIHNHVQYRECCKHLFMEHKTQHNRKLVLPCEFALSFFLLCLSKQKYIDWDQKHDFLPFPMQQNHGKILFLTAVKYCKIC